jgi:enterochelin esterase-like enzyme
VSAGALVVAQPAVADTATDSTAAADPWVSTTPEGYYRFTVPQSAVKDIVGSTPVTVEMEGNIGPSGTWSDVALDPSGSSYTALVGPMAPGLYEYQYVATMADRSRVSFKEPTSPVAVTAQPTWNTFFVPGTSVQWMSDIPAGGTVATMKYTSTVTGDQRSALVWTPPGYDPNRAAAYPVLYLLDGDGQSAAEWSELGRAPQILDNLVAEGSVESMVVVMADASVADSRAELLDNIVPATRAAYHVSDAAAQQALAGVGKGGYQALSTLLTDPGTFGSVGSFSGYLYSSIGASAATAINEHTDLLRLYVGNTLDPAYNQNYSLIQRLNDAGVKYEFDGVNPASGGTWDSWRADLRDFASRLFHDASDHGMSSGHRALNSAYQAPAVGSITTPNIDANKIVTFETGTQWADAKDVTVWANWAPNGAWFRIPMTKEGDRWRLTLGPLDGFYYYRYVVDGVDQKDPADTTTPLTGVSPLYVAGQTDTMLGDVPAGQGGTVTTMTYHSDVANEDRKALVWTPPGYDANRAEPYPVLYLQHGAGQSYGDWVETGRAKQILDNHYVNGDIVPMVVVMGNGNVSDFQAELLNNIMPAARAQYHVSSDPSQQALVGLSMGGMNTLSTVLAHPGEFAYVSSFSGFLFGTPSNVDVAKVNAGTKLLRIYSGDISDFVYSFTGSLLKTFDTLGINYQFAGYTTGPHGFDTWSANLIDLLPRLFRPDTTAGIPVQAVVPEGENGVLALTVADSGNGVALSQSQNAGDRLRFTGQLPTVTVSDSRTLKQAGAGGWAVSAQAYTFNSQFRTLGAEDLGWAPRVETPRTGLTAGAAVSTALSDGPGLATPAPLATANATGRYGSTTLGADLILEVPVDTQPGTYTGTLTLSLFPVD